VDGDDLFVVRAKRDASVVVKDGDVVAKGDVLAEFRPPEIEAQLAVLDARIEEARSRVGVLRPVSV